MTVLTKVTYWHFEISNAILKKIEILINVGPHGSENF